MSLLSIKKVLIANRGEIALRIIRACRANGIKSVIVYSVADKNLLPIKLADEAVCIGGAALNDSYLNAAAILSAAEITNVDAIHPGYGFLSENANFAAQVQDTGFIFIGPDSDNIRLMGDKISARNFMIKNKVQCVPGEEIPANIQTKDLCVLAKNIGYPVIFKAAAGGGGRGMQVVHSESELFSCFDKVTYESGAFFNNSNIYLEKFLFRPRHIECQIAVDNYGNVQFIGTRDCSIQRRHQKLVEEAEAFGLSEEHILYLRQSCEHIAKTMRYKGVGTFEFLLSEDKLYFIEMNTRLQVEHTVTEMVYGIDLVELQFKIAMGESIANLNLQAKGFAIECRINAENSFTHIPSPGLITMLHLPGGPGVRVDSHIYNGYKVPSEYDSLLAKIIVHGNDRSQAILRMQQALSELIIEGIDCNIDLHKKIFASNNYRSGNVNTNFIEMLI